MVGNIGRNDLWEIWWHFVYMLKLLKLLSIISKMKQYSNTIKKMEVISNFYDKHFYQMKTRRKYKWINLQDIGACSTPKSKMWTTTQKLFFDVRTSSINIHIHTSKKYLHKKIKDISCFQLYRKNILFVPANVPPHLVQNICQIYILKSKFSFLKFWSVGIWRVVYTLAGTNKLSKHRIHQLKTPPCTY
jgi:hypothetical protein